jgi:hypothetical protein
MRRRRTGSAKVGNPMAGAAVLGESAAPFFAFFTARRGKQSGERHRVPAASADQ